MSNELTKNIGKLYLYDNNCTQIFKLGKSKSNSDLIKNKKRNTLIVITAKQLKQEIRDGEVQEICTTDYYLVFLDISCSKHCSNEWSGYGFTHSKY